MSDTTIRLRPDIEAPLKKLAKDLDRSKNKSINQALQEFIERQAMENVRWLETVPALKSVQAGKTLSAPEVLKWIESWGTNSELSKSE